LLLRLAYWLIEKSPKLAFNESINSGIIYFNGVGTNRNYLEALKHIAKHTTGNLRDLTKEQATQYLVDRSVQVGQSSLNMSRQVMQHLIGDKLPVESINSRIIYFNSFTQ
jgi:hypothetical protein